MLTIITKKLLLGMTLDVHSFINILQPKYKKNVLGAIKKY